jgi:hypothetical protein
MSRRTIFKGAILDVGIDSVVLPNGVQAELEIVRHRGGSAAVALDAPRSASACSINIGTRRAAGCGRFQRASAKRMKTPSRLRAVSWPMKPASRLALDFTPAIPCQARRPC